MGDVDGNEKSKKESPKVVEPQYCSNDNERNNTDNSDNINASLHLRESTESTYIYVH